jgi:hypothetical protein
MFKSGPIDLLGIDKTGNVVIIEIKRDKLPREALAQAIMSSQLGMKKNDFLRQVVAYEYPNFGWEKDNFSIRDKFKDVVREVLKEIREKTGANNSIQMGAGLNSHQ